MKRFIVPAIAVLCMAIAGTADAQLLNPPLSQPAMSYNNSGTVVYDSTSQTFTMNATALAFVDANGAHPVLPPFTGTVSLVIPVDNTGALVAGNTTAVDLVVTGEIDTDGDTVPEYTGTLLTARVTAFGYEDTAPTLDRFDALLDVTGGSLAGVMPAQVGMSFISENSTFAGSFEQDFGGGAKGSLAAIDGVGCPRSPGYWKTHCNDWPVDSLTLGGVEYDSGQLLNILWGKTPEGDFCPDSASVKLAKFLVAAKFDLLSGAQPAGIVPTVEAADSLLAVIGITCDTPAEHEAAATALKDLLDEYVNLECGEDDCDDPCDKDCDDDKEDKCGKDWDWDWCKKDWDRDRCDKDDDNDRDRCRKHNKRDCHKCDKDDDDDNDRCRKHNKRDCNWCDWDKWCDDEDDDRDRCRKHNDRNCRKCDKDNDSDSDNDRCRKHNDRNCRKCDNDDHSQDWSKNSYGGGLLSKWLTNWCR